MRDGCIDSWFFTLFPPPVLHVAKWTMSAFESWGELVKRQEWTQCSLVKSLPFHPLVMSLVLDMRQPIFPNQIISLSVTGNHPTVSFIAFPKNFWDYINLFQTLATMFVFFSSHLNFNMSWRGLNHIQWTLNTKQKNSWVSLNCALISQKQNSPCENNFPGMFLEFARCVVLLLSSAFIVFPFLVGTKYSSPAWWVPSRHMGTQPSSWSSVSSSSFWLVSTKTHCGLILEQEG